MPPRDWNADSYQRVSAPLEQMGRDVLDRLVLAGDERVLDAGCGTGRVTAALLERLPRGHVTGVDGSPAMIEQARALLPPEVELEVQDLARLSVDEPFDAILSTATFHWIADHDRLFERLRGALKPAGRLVVQCGGEGNIAAVRAAIDRVGHPDLAGWPGPWHFAGLAETHDRLVRMGFTDVWCWPQLVRVVPDDLEEYLATVVLGSHLERLAPGDREGLVKAVRAQLDDDGIEYVRLNVLARAAS